MSQEPTSPLIREVDDRQEQDHPDRDRYLRMDRMPHIWCPTCGIGTVVKCYATALELRRAQTWTRSAVVSGIGCTGQGRRLHEAGRRSTPRTAARCPFATGLKLGRPELQVTVFLRRRRPERASAATILIHAARRNMDLLVVLVNNFHLRHDRRPERADHTR